MKVVKTQVKTVEIEGVNGTPIIQPHAYFGRGGIDLLHDDVGYDIQFELKDIPELAVILSDLCKDNVLKDLVAL